VWVGGLQVNAPTWSAAGGGAGTMVVGSPRPECNGLGGVEAGATPLHMAARHGHTEVTQLNETVANRNVRDSGWEIAHGAVTRRPPFPLYTMIPRTGGYTHDVGVWDLSIVQRPFSVARP
jgi:hypothetical protein